MKIQELSQGILEGKWTSEQLTKQALSAIAANDHSGRNLNSLAELNGDAIFIARAMDQEIREQGLRSPLHGIPIVLKDNIDVRGMHNTAGSYALNDLICDKDSFLAARLREAGAVIIGKTNLSEFAYWMSTDNMPSGYSSRNGQVNHAYQPGFDVSGSSSGSAVAVSARFVPLSIGTETDGSIMYPAIANAITAIKPTVGLVSRNGILPISHVQDTAGPMANSVNDVAVLLDVMTGRDEDDPATWVLQKKDYLAALSQSIKGKRAGIMIFKNAEMSDDCRKATEKLREILRTQGCEPVEIEYDQGELDEFALLNYEFKNDLERYLAAHNCRNKTLAAIIQFNKDHSERCLKYGQGLLESSEAVSGQFRESEYWQKRLELDQQAHELIEGVMARENVDVLIYAASLPVTNLAAVSGNPSLTIPAVAQSGEPFSPMSYYLMAGPWQEDVLISFAAAIEKELNITCKPSWVADKYW
ncbi:MAG: hypothetical protein II704_06445 [Erysipelotrichaceae bacterium]|nr:hypothetical protein [Erysipelotrichaceae bacterium]